jgi:hypothetical protein
MKSLSLFLETMSLFAWGCGGGGSATPGVAPSALSYTVSTAVYRMGVAIAPDNPTSTGGSVISYSVSPALPTGIVLDTGTGIISGTPTVLAAAANYIVTATNASGSAAETLRFTVNNLSSATLAYTPSTVVYTVGTAITPFGPSYSGGTAGYSVTPTLPGGLSLDPNTGIITGNPNPLPTATLTESYTVTATNASGDSIAKLSISVNEVAPWSQSVPNMNQTITPLAPAGAQFQQLNPDLADDPAWVVSHAVTSIVSPALQTMLVLTSGFNLFYNSTTVSLFSGVPQDSTEYVFVYDISKNTPIKTQVIQLPTAYHGIAFDPTSTPSSAHFYVGGGAADLVYSFTLDPLSNLWSMDLSPNPKPAPASPLAPALAMAHGTGNGLKVVPPSGQVTINEQVFVYPCAAGVALSADGNKLVVVNYYNDSISVFTGGFAKWHPSTNVAVPYVEVDLRLGKAISNPLHGTPGGEYPFWAVVAGNGQAATPYIAYVSSIRDREIDAVNLNMTPPVVTARVRVKGQPNKMTMNKAQTLLYVAEDQLDAVDVIDINPANTSTVNTVIETIPVIAPPAPSPLAIPSTLTQYSGANTNNVALSPDETKLYVTNGNLNNVAVVALTGTNSGDEVIGLIPPGGIRMPSAPASMAPGYM